MVRSWTARRPRTGRGSTGLSQPCPGSRCRRSRVPPRRRGSGRPVSRGRCRRGRTGLRRSRRPSRGLQGQGCGRPSRATAPFPAFKSPKQMTGANLRQLPGLGRCAQGTRACRRRSRTDEEGTIVITVGCELDLIVHSPDGESRGLLFRVGDVFPMLPTRHTLSATGTPASMARPWGLRSRATFLGFHGDLRVGRPGQADTVPPGRHPRRPTRRRATAPSALDEPLVKQQPERGRLRSVRGGRLYDAMRPCAVS
jgi:hypothetical protein